MPTFVVCCSQGAAASAELVRNALAGGVDAEIAQPGPDRSRELMAGRCDGLVLPLDEARREADRLGVSCQVIARRERRDVLLASDSSSSTLAGLHAALRVGAVGRRRAALLRAFRPDLETVLLPDDFDAARARLSAGDVSALVAGGEDVVDGGLQSSVSEWLEPTAWVPAAGSGGLGLLLPPHRGPILVAPHVVASVEAEEAVLEGLGGVDVGVIGALALPYGPHLRLWGLVVSPCGERAVRVDLTGTVAEGRELGMRVAEVLISRGAGLTGRDVGAENDDGARNAGAGTDSGGLLS
jgi:hydroxymethylbilane synthase